MKTSVVSLNKPINVLTIPGITMRSAWGIITSAVILQYPRPTA